MQHFDFETSHYSTHTHGICSKCLHRFSFVRCKFFRYHSSLSCFPILNVAENPVAQNVGGYLVSPNKENCPIFVNYHKEDDISESTKYEDEFINNKEFGWMSKSNRKRNSPDVKSILGDNGTSVPRCFQSAPLVSFWPDPGSYSILLVDLPVPVSFGQAG